MGCCPFADESYSWDALHAQYEMKRINHEEAYSMDIALALIGRKNFSAGCVAPNRATTIISPVRICSAMRKRLHHLSADPATEVNSRAALLASSLDLLHNRHTTLSSVL
jgi:hypothetical protein